MATRLTDNLNSLYLGAANRLKPKKARRRIVAYVESYDDVLFWRSVLAEFENDRYFFEVMLPAKDSLQKGKKRVLMNQLGPQLGQNMIACVDADYDYLMQNLTNTSRIVNGNPYVFHTYVYAIENYQCYAPGLHSACVMATLNDHLLVDFEQFMALFSEIVYPLFIWSVWCYRNGTYKDFSLMDFADVVALEDVSIYHPEHALERLRNRVNKKVAKLQHHFPQARHTYQALKDELTTLGVTQENTYLFIQGHTLFDLVALPLLEPVCVELRRERERDIKRYAEHEVQLQNELSCYQHSQAPIEVMLRKSNHYIKSEPYQRMREDIQRFLDRLDKETMQPVESHATFLSKSDA